MTTWAPRWGAGTGSEPGDPTFIIIPLVVVQQQLLKMNYPELEKKYNAVLEKQPDVAMLYSTLVDDGALWGYQPRHIFADAVAMVQSGYVVDMNKPDDEVVKDWINWTRCHDFRNMYFK